MRQSAANDTMGDLLIQFAEELANKAGISKDKNTIKDFVSKIRWYPNKAGAIVIVKRGADRKVLATISPKAGEWSHLYPSWQKALAELEQKRVANSVSRVSHDGIGMGDTPLAESEKE